MGERSHLDGEGVSGASAVVGDSGGGNGPAARKEHEVEGGARIWLRSDEGSSVTEKA